MTLVDKKAFLRKMEEKGLIECIRGKYYSLCAYNEEITIEINEILKEL